MTKEQLKRANKILEEIEQDRRHIKNLSVKGKVRYISIEDVSQDPIVMFSYKDVSDRRKAIIDELISICIEAANQRIESLEKELEAM